MIRVVDLVTDLVHNVYKRLTILIVCLSHTRLVFDIWGVKLYIRVGRKKWKMVPNHTWKIRPLTPGVVPHVFLLTFTSTCSVTKIDKILKRGTRVILSFNGKTGEIEKNQLPVPIPTVPNLFLPSGVVKPLQEWPVTENVRSDKHRWWRRKVM